MPAFVIVEVEIEDPEKYETYKGLTPATIQAYDGRFIVRGGKTKTLEGDWDPGRIVILEFPSIERAEQWWSSPEYSKAKSIRHEAARARMILVEGT